jgi:hypothetical protein
MKVSINWPLVATLLFLNAFLLFLLFPFGPNLQVDTANYYSAAKNFVEGNGFKLFDGQFLKNTPPLFPLLISLVYFLKLAVAPFIWGHQFLCFNLFLFFLFRISKILLFEPILFLLVCVLFGFAPLHIWKMALSEAPFLAAQIAWIYFWIREDKKAVFFSALAFAAMTLLRYQAWFMLPGLFLPIFFKRISFKDVFFSTLPALLFNLLWWGYLFFKGNAVLGDHQLYSKLSFIALLNNLQAWYTGLKGAFGLNVAFGVLLLLTSFFWVFLLGKRNLVKDRTYLILLGISTSLMLFILLQNNLSLFQLPRYLSVLWPLQAILLIISIKSLFFKETRRRNTLVIIMLVNLVGLVFLHRMEGKAKEVGIMSQLAKPNTQLVKADLGNQILLSNFPDLVWWLKGGTCYYSQFTQESAIDFNTRIGEANSFKLIWFTLEERNHVMAPFPGLPKDKKIKPYLEGEGFIIYELER